MKKCLLFCLMLVLSMGAFMACAASMPNPVTEYASLDEINEIVGSNLVHPAVMGVSDESFAVIDDGEHYIAQYSFRVNGLEYTMRCAAVADEDISGVWIGGDVAFPGGITDQIEYAFDEGIKVSRWFDINGQYVLIQLDHENVMDEETFKAITEEFVSLTSIVPSEEEMAARYEELAGNYEDEYSQRAHMEVTANGAEGVYMTVYWADSAFAHAEWKMSARFGEDGLLYYTDCVCCWYNYEDYEDENTYSVETLYENGEGFFSLSENKLYWNGAGEENCRDCVFAKYVEE